MLARVREATRVLARVSESKRVLARVRKVASEARSELAKVIKVVLLLMDIMQYIDSIEKIFFI